jgi:hypothetical protein
VERSIKALAPEVIIVCQCSIQRDLENLVSRLTKPMCEAESIWTLESAGKSYTVVSAFHPSAFAKSCREGRLPDRSAVRKAALLEFCFLRAVNKIHGVEIAGYGLQKLRATALS